MGVIVVQDPQTLKPYSIQIAGDSPTEDEQKEIQEFIQQQRQVVDTPVEPTDDKSGTALGRGASVGIDMLQQMYGSAIEGVGNVTGIDALRDYGASVVETNEQQIAEKQQDFTRREDIGKDGSYVGDAFSFYGETLGQNLPQLGTSIGAGLVAQTALPFAPGVGFLIGALASNIPFFYGSHRERQKEAVEQGVRTELDEGTAFMYSLPAAALDTVVDRILVGLKPLGLGLNKTALSPTVGGIFTRAAKGAGAGATVEIPTEIGQQVIERYQAGLPIDNDEAIKEYIDVGIAAGLVGGTVKATTSVVTGDTKENIEKKEAALTKRQLEIDNALQTAEAKELQQNAEKNLEEGFDGVLPVDRSIEEATILTSPTDPSEDQALRRQTGEIKVFDLRPEYRNILLQERQKADVDVDNPVTDLQEIKRFLEPRTRQGITAEIANEINTMNVPKRFEESQYNTVVNYFKKKSVDTKELTRENIVDRVKKILVSGKQTDEGGAVTNTTARRIVDQMVLDGHISLARPESKGNDRTYVINEETLNDKRNKELENARKLLENAKERKPKIQEEREEAFSGEVDNSIQAILNRSDKQRKLDDVNSEIKNLNSTITRLQKEIKESNPTLNLRRKTATEINPVQQKVNNALITAEQAAKFRQADKDKEKAQYINKRDDVLRSLRKYMAKLGLADVELVAENVIGTQGKDLSKKDFIVEGEFNDSDGRRIISLAMSLYDRNLSNTEFEQRLQGVLNHEIIHAVKSLGLFTDAEYKSLVKAAMTRKYVVKDGKKLIERRYTYFDRAKSLYPDLNQEGVQEEAIAEMFRDAMDGKLKLAGRPKTLMQRFIDFFKSIFNAHEENGFQNVDDIFEGIRTGDIGERARTDDREYLDTKVSPQAEQGKQSRRSLTTTLNPVTAKEEIRANKVGGKITVPDLQNYLQDFHMKTYGRRLDFANSEDRAIAINTAVPEILDMLKRDVSGKGWYDEDVVKTFEMLSQIPDLESLKSNENRRVLWSAIAGVTSNGNSVPLNAKVSTSQLLRLFRTGKLDTVQPVAGSTVEGVVNAGFGSRGPTVAKGLDLLNKLLDKFGEKGFAEFWLSQHTLRELGEIRKEAGFGGAPGSLSGGMNSMHLGAKIIGDKTGNFSLAINGYDVSTKDVWFTRMIRRLEGTFDTKGRHLEGKEKGKEFGQPKGAVDRQNMDDFMAELQGDPRIAKFNLSKRDLQAILWYKEQNLYTELGVPSRPQSFSEGIETLNDLLPEGQRFQRSDDAETQAQRGATQLEGFRERTAGQEALPTTTGTAKRSVRKLHNFIRENPEGFTITSDKLEPVSGGFPVAPLKDAEIIVKGDITRSVLREYVQNARDLATALDREVFLGGWLDNETNQYYLDNVVLPDNREEALYIAEIADQEAFYDLNTFEEVRTQDGIRQLKQDGAYRSDISERLRRDLEQARKRFKEARLQRDRRSKQSRRATAGEVNPTLFDVAPQEDLDKLSEAVNRLDEQVVTPNVKYSRLATKPSNPNALREIPINFENVPIDYKRQLSESALRYAYGYVRERGGDVIPVTYTDGNHVVLKDGREGGYGAWHIVTRGHDKEIRDATGQEPDRVIYTMMNKMIQQEYGNAGYQGIDVKSDTGRSIQLTWESNRPKGYPPIILSLMFQPSTKAYTVRTIYPTREQRKPRLTFQTDRNRSRRPSQDSPFASLQQLNLQSPARRSVRRLSVAPTGSQSLFGAEGTFGELDQRLQATTYTNSLQAIEKVIRGGTLGFVSQEKAKKLATSFISKFQDKMIPVAIMLDELKKKGLKLRDAFDPYLQDELFYGITGREITSRQEGIYNDIVQGIKRLIVTDSDIDGLISASKANNPLRSSFVDEQIKAGKDKKVALFEAYLYAKHAKERNAYILDKTSQEIDKMTPNEVGSGMTDAEADAIINWFDTYANKTQVEVINGQVRQVVADTNRVRQDGQLSPIFDEDDAPWKSYVPLKGSLDPDDETAELSNRPVQVNKQIKGKREDRQVTGRSKYATDIMGNLFQQNTTAILRAERNKVGLSMLNLLETNDPNVVTTTEADLARTDFGSVIQVTPRKKVVDTRTGVISQRPVTAQEIAQDPNVLIVKRRNPDNEKEIQEVAIEFTDPRIASAMRGDSLVSPSHGMSGIRFLARVNRFLASVNTSYNPAFIVPNFSRDLITASINIAQYDLPNVQRDMLKNVPSSMKGIKRFVFNNDRERTDSEGNLTDVGYYMEFLEAGGQNVLNTVTTLADQVRDINNIMGNVAKRPIRDSFVGKGAKKLGSLLENTNIVAENAMRVATYKTLRQKGFTPARAAQAARNVTVNFAKTGEYGRILNSMYLFYNASIQGTFAALQAATKSRKVRTMWAGLIAYGLMQDQLAALFGEEDEDGNLIYDKIPDYTLEHNLILPDLVGVTDRSFITIPFPYGFNMAFNTGRSLSRWSRGAYTAGEAANSMEGTLYEIINPLGGTESFLNFVAPTVADPFISVAQNFDYAGRPIYKEPSQFGIGKPDSQLYWNSTTNTAKFIAEKANELTGGTKGVSGVIDVNPALIDFWFEYTIGGLGRFVNNVGDLAVGTVTGDPKGLLIEGFSEENVRRLPVARKFVYSVSEREDVGEFVEKRDRVLLALKELKRTMKQGDREGYKETQERFKDELKIAGLINGYNNARNRLMRLRNQIQENERIPESQKEKLVERYNEMIQNIVAKSNIAMRDIEVSFLEDLLD